MLKEAAEKGQFCAKEEEKKEKTRNNTPPPPPPILKILNLFNPPNLLNLLKKYYSKMPVLYGFSVFLPIVFPIKHCYYPLF